MNCPDNHSPPRSALKHSTATDLLTIDTWSQSASLEQLDTPDDLIMATNPTGQSPSRRHTTEGETSAASITPTSSAATSREDTAHIFRFFDLPRELRDKIYEQPVLMDHWLVPFYPEQDIHIEAEKLSMSLLLVNRQFRDEYTEMCEDQQALLLHDAFRSLDDASILNEVDMLRCWTLGICYWESAREPDALFHLEDYLGECARWFKGLPAANVRLYISHRQDFDDYTPRVFDRLENNIAEIASFQKIAEVEIYATKRTRSRTSITWSRKLLARWCRAESPSDIFLDRAPHGGKIEWEVYSKTSLDDDDSTSSYHSFDSWPEDWGDDSKDHSSDWGDDGGNNDFSHLMPCCGRKRDRDVDSEVWQVNRSTDDGADNGADEEEVEGNAGTGDRRFDRKSESDAMERVRQWLLLEQSESDLSDGPRRTTNNA